MTKQIQDAYIVAASRTPIGRSHRGYFRNTRPDDLLIAAVHLVKASAIVSFRPCGAVVLSRAVAVFAS